MNTAKLLLITSLNVATQWVYFIQTNGLDSLAKKEHVPKNSKVFDSIEKIKKESYAHIYINNILEHSAELLGRKYLKEGHNQSNQFLSYNLKKAHN